MGEEKKENVVSVEDIKAQVIAEMEAKAAKEEEEAKAKAEATAAIKEAARKEVETELKKEIEAAKATVKTETPAVIKSAKLDENTQQLFDLVKSEGINSIEYDIDINRAQEIISSGKALDGASTQGAELVPEEYATGMYVRMEAMGGGLFKKFPKAIMSSNIQNIHEITGDVTVSAYSSYSTGNTAIENVTASTPATAEQTLNARTFVAKIYVYDHLADDQKVNLIRALRNKMAVALDNQISNAILNGDTTATHMDEDSEALGANVPVAMWKGLRKYSMAVSALNSDLTDAGFTLADLATVAKTGGKYVLGENMKKAFWILGVKGYNQLRSLILASTATPTTATAALVNGELTKYLGHAIVTSEYQREDLEIDGYQDNTGVTGTQGFVTLVNPTEFLIGLRKNFTIKVVPDPLNGRKVIIGEMRLDFKPFEVPSADVTSVVSGYGFTA